MNDSNQRQRFKVEHGEIKEHTTERIERRGLVERGKHFLKRVYLPEGYPHSVAPEYLNFALRASIQSIASSSSYVLATHAMFLSVGISDGMAATFSGKNRASWKNVFSLFFRTDEQAGATWVLKDGIGSVGAVLFAGLKTAHWLG